MMFLFCRFNGEEGKCWRCLPAPAKASGNPQDFKVLLVADRSGASAEKEPAEGLHGQKFAGAFVQITSGRQMSVAKNGRSAHGTAVSAPPRPGYGMPTGQERGQSLRSTATLRVYLDCYAVGSIFPVQPPD